ncbi:segregation/condensation protein A [Ureaplasma urealyticum]|nr:segregation/condensation protein A [Ureaplasma urealyticum]
MSQNQMQNSLFEYKFIDFNGPLDTLCALIKQKRLDINNLDILELSKQYLNFVNQLIKTIDIDVLGDHLAMASYLIELKTRMLMPSIDEKQILNIEEDRQNLIDRLIEYNGYKNLTEHLKQRLDFRATMIDLPQQDYEQFYSEDVVYKPLPNCLDPIILKNIMDKIIYENELKNYEIDEIKVQEYDINQLEWLLLNYLNQSPNQQASMFSFFNVQAVVDKNKRFFVMMFLIILILINRNEILFEEIENDYLLKINNEKISDDYNSSSIEQAKNLTNDLT